MRPAVLVVVGGVLGAALGWLALQYHFMPVAASKQADRFDQLWAGFIILSGVIFGIVLAILSYEIVKFRAKPGETGDGKPLHGITWLEIVWTAIPLIIVITISVISYVILDKNGSEANAAPINASSPATPGKITVDIHGFRYNWAYSYRDFPDLPKDQDTLVLPVGYPVVFKVTSKDVLHSFWVPNWRIQMYATPGQTNTITVTPTKIGDFPVVCAFLCGGGHAQMNSTVQGGIPHKIKVVSVADWLKFLAAGKLAAAAAAANPNAAGIAAFNSAGCGGCHALTAAGSNGAVGPSLDNVSADAAAAGKPLQDFIKESIQNPGAYIAKGYPNAMPANIAQNLSSAQIDALVKLISGAKQ